MKWWCEMRRAWIGPDGSIVETEEAIAARRGVVPRTIGRWMVEAFKALGVLEPRYLR